MIALQENSLVIPSEDTHILGEAARDAGAYVVIGCNELDDRPGSQTVYNTLLFIDRNGEVLGRHRKTMPTYTERIYWGMGDASDLRVFDTDIGRIGGLICWENHMTLIRAAMIHRGEEFHIAVWPGNWKRGEDLLLDAEAQPREIRAALGELIEALVVVRHVDHRVGQRPFLRRACAGSAPALRHGRDLGIVSQRVRTQRCQVGVLAERGARAVRLSSTAHASRQHSRERECEARESTTHDASEVFTRATTGGRVGTGTDVARAPVPYGRDDVVRNRSGWG
jgi:predicted amidohydrolase